MLKYYNYLDFFSTQSPIKQHCGNHIKSKTA